MLQYGYDTMEVLLFFICVLIILIVGIIVCFNQHGCGNGHYYEYIGNIYVGEMKDKHCFSVFSCKRCGKAKIVNKITGLEYIEQCEYSKGANRYE